MTSRASLVRQRVQAATTRYLLKTFDRDLQSTVVVPKATKKRNGMITVPIQYGMDLLRVNITRLNVLGFNERAWEKDSLYTGLGCGRLTFDANGRLVKGLGARRIAMVNYLLNTRFCVFEVRKYPGGFICCYPHAYGYVLVERLRKMAGVAGIAERGDIRRRRLTVGRFRVEVLEYDGIFDFKVDPETFLNLLRLKDARLRGAFMAISEPAVFVAFDRVFYVRRRYQRGLNDEILEMNPMTAERLLGRFEIVKKDFLAGKRRRAEKAHAPRVYSTVPRTRFPDLEGAMPDADWIRQREAGIPRSNKTLAARDVRLQRFLDYACDFLRGAVDPSPVRKVVNGVAYAGEISAPDSLIYPPIWTVDHFMNAMGLIPFDLSASMRLCEGGLIAYMRMDDPHKGLIPLKATPETTSTSSFPLWAPACWWNYLHSGGRGRATPAAKTSIP